LLILSDKGNHSSHGVYKKILASAKVKMCEGEGKVVNAHTVELTTPDGEVKQFSG
jgi:pyruvate/2-oxoglutarate dehydrogenase complex dihydrolipoamide dehydrogenase (E3) component